jgi:alpha-tubulin suppressor-like RCC1 family protein
VQVAGLTNVKAIVAGDYTPLVLKNDGTVWAWGRNAYGQVGDGTITPRATPVQVVGLSNVTAI